MSNLVKGSEYKQFIATIKSQIQLSQIKAAVLVNRELLKLYWFIGSQIVEKQKSAHWGDGLIQQTSYDLQHEFPDMKGFSYRNIKYMKQWFMFWNQTDVIGQQVVAQLEQAPVPDDQTLNMFHNEAELLFDKIDKNQIQIHTLESFREILLPKLMSGEVRMAGYG